MNSLGQLALNTYYFGTLPLRASLRQRLAASGHAPVCVLFYHRVADSHPNDWTISNAQFQTHIRWLQGHFPLVSLAAAQARIAAGNNRETTVTITFDDGYAENCDQAIPFLIDQQVPCTYFVAHEFIVSGRPFPHDLAVGQPRPPNTPDQLIEMAQHGIQIGAHTRRHVDLGQVNDPQTLNDEIVTVRDELSELVDQPVDYFAFPFGQPTNMSSRACRLARQAGYRGVCSAYGNYNTPGHDAFHIQRIHGDPQLARLKNWLTLDPRKLGRRTPFQIDWES